MVTKTFIRKSFMLGARYSGLAGAMAPILRGRGGILMLHRVGPCANGLCINGFLSVQPTFLDRLLGKLKSDGYVFCSMDEVVDRIKARHTDERFLALTLDDGYRDNLIAAKPVFEAHNVPYTIYVCPGFVEGYAKLWWENLAAVIERQDRITFTTDNGLGGIDCRTSTEKRAAYQQLLEYLTTELDELQQRHFVEQLCSAYGVDSAAHVKSEIMSWEELRQINRSELCTLGAHTLNHYHLARLDEAEAVFEMEQSAKVIALETGTKPTHLAFPYGAAIAAGKREADLARAIGFKTAVTTRHGLIHEAHKDFLHCLPRISINGNYQRSQYIQTLLTGIAVPFANAGRKVVTV